MNSELKDTENQTPEFADPEVDSKTTTLSLPSAEQSGEQFKQISEKISAFLAGLPEYLSDFFGEYRRPLITLGLIFGGIVTVKMTLALLDAVDDIPLLAPLFEMVGFGYTIWFVYRYLLKAENRQELGKEVENLKGQIVGKLPK